jgi:cyanophycinase-like exopeptidase
MSSTAPIALVGSGEYLPVMTDIERALIDGRPPKYVQLATAAAPEGDESLARWHALGRAQAERLGAEQVVVDVRTREDADTAELATLVAGAGLVYLSGGNPAYLADTLRDTAVWRAIVDAHEAGAALAGCSAGAMALSDWAPRMRDLVHTTQPTGLGVVPKVRVIPHFDKMLGWMPDMLRNALLHTPSDSVLLGIDEDTALVGGPHEWTVQGRQSVWVLSEGSRIEYAAGATLTTP